MREMQTDKGTKNDVDVPLDKGFSHFRRDASLGCLALSLGVILMGYAMGSYFSYIEGTFSPGVNEIRGLSRAYNAQLQPRAALSAGRTQEISVRVLTQNARYKNWQDYGWRAWARRASAVSAIAGDTGCDIVAFQEMLPSMYQDLKGLLSTTHDSVYAERDPAHAPSEGVPIFFRRSQFRLLSTSTSWLSSTPGKAGSSVPGAGSPRIVTVARLQHRGSGRTLTVLNTHLDNRSGSARAVGASLVAQQASEALESGPVVITGDLNSYGGRGDEPVRRLMDGVPGLVDTLTAADSNAGDASTFHDFTAKPKGRGRIDYVFAASRQGVRVVRAWIHAKRYHGVLPSDHFGVVADIVL